VGSPAFNWNVLIRGVKMEKCECPNCGAMCEVEYDDDGFTGIVNCEECGEQELVYSIYDEI
jgi:DNA replicative helicase MCM subunit Mcm2 (Cdc46/Mcm family)